MNPILEAEYADGYIHSEIKLKDVSPYENGRNVFYDILNKLPEAEHGPMVSFRLFNNGEKYAIDWTKIPSNAKPIRFKSMRRDKTFEKDPTNDEMMLVSEILTVDHVGFGYEYLDDENHNQKFIKVIK